MLHPARALAGLALPTYDRIWRRKVSASIKGVSKLPTGIQIYTLARIEGKKMPTELEEVGICSALFSWNHQLHIVDTLLNGSSLSSSTMATHKFDKLVRISVRGRRKNDR